MNLRSTVLDPIKKYTRRYLLPDVSAAITVTVLLVPQGMAYALLAGVPPIYGLYAAIVPLLIYGISGSSRHLSLGPVALLSILLLSGLTRLAEPGSVEFINLAITTALIAGLIQLLLGLTRMGSLINFLSNPVFIGFIVAAVVIILGSQIANLLGLHTSHNSHFPDLIYNLMTSLDQTDWITMLIGIGSLLTYWGLRMINTRLPGALIVVACSTLITYYFRLDQYGVSIVGYVPKGLPHFAVPTISKEIFFQLLPLALTISLISFIESMAIANQIASKSRDYHVYANQELIALGLSKFVGAFFQSIPTDGSFSRSAINFESGGKTKVSGIVTALFIALILFFITSWFYYLPRAALSAIIVVAVGSIVDIREIKRLYTYHKVDFITMLVTFSLTLLLGVQQGVLTGVILSLAFIIYRSSKPHLAMLGQIPDSSDYRNIERFPDTLQWPEILIIRFDAQLYFANAKYFHESLVRAMEAKGPKLKHIILDASAISDIDSTGMQVMVGIIRDLIKKNITFTMAGCIGPVRDFIKKTTIKDVIETGESFLNVQNAINYLEHKYPSETETS